MMYWYGFSGIRSFEYLIVKNTYEAQAYSSLCDRLLPTLLFDVTGYNTTIACIMRAQRYTVTMWIMMIRCGHVVIMWILWTMCVHVGTCYLLCGLC